MNETKKSYFEARCGTGVPCGHHHRKIRAVIRCTDRLNKIVRSAGGEFCAFVAVAVRPQGTVPPGEESLKINTTVHRHDLEKGNMLSTISGKCEVCGNATPNCGRSCGAKRRAHRSRRSPLRPGGALPLGR